MLKILEKGEERKYQITCPHCDALLEYNMYDTYKTYSREERQGYYTVENYILCPSCKGFVNIMKTENVAHFREYDLNNKVQPQAELLWGGRRILK